ncbi:MAG TPA: hypothetical protein DDZ88_16790 [Verrucomicrobiales bacterium]|nr:hypothetical protein [Verrucomicrobiales bacterium]
MNTIIGTVQDGNGHASGFLIGVHPLIEARTGLLSLRPGTLNLKLDADYFVRQDATVTELEYQHREALFFQKCRIGDLPCLIMRPESHEKYRNAHGPAHLEIMAQVRLRDHYQLVNGSKVEVELEVDEDWWKEKICRPPESPPDSNS